MMNHRTLAQLTIVGLAIAMISGCSCSELPSSTPHVTSTDAATPPASDEELVVLCGTSFGPPVEKLAKMFEDHLKNETRAVRMLANENREVIPYLYCML